MSTPSMSINFIDKLNYVIKKNNSFLCVGLDTDKELIPKEFHSFKEPIFEFNKFIIDATHDLVCAYKPQIAYYASQRAEDQLEKTMDYIRTQYPEILTILDSKRGDIDSTAVHYAKESFERYGADAVTVNPYLGYDSIAPFLEYKNKGVILLCKTSNKSSGDFQDLKIISETNRSNKFLFEIIAEKAIKEWNHNKNLALVIGATYPKQMKQIRELDGEIPFLVPGVGAQGGDLKEVLSHGLGDKGKSLIVNASRSIIYASNDKDSLKQKSREVSLNYLSEMRKFINS